TAPAPRLKSSTKSFANGAPELPPPAKSWLTTRSVDALSAVGAPTRPPTTRAATRTRTRIPRMGNSNQRGTRLLPPLLCVRATPPTVSFRESARSWHGSALILELTVRVAKRRLAGERALTHPLSVRSDLPTGTVTFLLCDIERSTTLLRELGAER